MSAAPAIWFDKVRLILPADTVAARDIDQTLAADQLPITIIEQTAEPDFQSEQFILKHSDGRWQLFPPTGNDAFGRHALYIDFVQNARFNKPLTLREPLAKAAGLRAGRRPIIVDLTAGLGRDAWALASAGCIVFAFERHPLVHFLLADALARARQEPKTRDIADRIQLFATDARQTSVDELKLDAYTVWLMDPMFPERQKSALVKKDMRIFHELVGADGDANALFEWALRRPGGRCVVKRPPHAPWLTEIKPSMTISSGRVRFDCYLKSSVQPA